MVVQQMFKYRIYPSIKQKIRLTNSLKTCKVIYNELLALSIDAYRFGNVSFTKSDYNKLLKEFKGFVYSQVAQNVRDRVMNAYSNFFRRVKDKSCKDKGFPRFKSRVNSITYPQSGFKLLSDKRLGVSKIGSIPIVLHRVPKGKIKTMTLKQNKNRQWFAVFCCELENKGKTRSFPQNSIGIDLGVENFASLSNGEVISNPRYLIKSEKRLKLLQRRLSRKVKGSANRRKARFRLAKQHLKVVNQRSDFLHKQSRSLTLKYGTIAVENLNVNGMLHNYCLAKSIGDASWGNFVRMLSYKAVNCGGQFIKVNPRNTSKTCSRCGTITEMPLSKRTFLCPSCGLFCHRDLNASLNILKVGTDCSEPNACEHNVRPTSLAFVNETGTICDS